MNKSLGQLSRDIQIVLIFTFQILPLLSIFPIPLLCSLSAYLQTNWIFLMSLLIEQSWQII